MNFVLGTKGYKDAIEEFTDVSLSLKFTDINAEFLPYIPKAKSKILDLGAGIGQNSAALAQLGHEVVSVEPLQEFLDIAKRNFKSPNITWINDSLPSLDKLNGLEGTFDFILIDGVWQHLDSNERCSALNKISRLLNKGGQCALSLRHGPAGAGTHVFPTCVKEVNRQALINKLVCSTLSQKKPSKLPNKSSVTWSRVLVRKP